MSKTTSINQIFPKTLPTERMDKSIGSQYNDNYNRYVLYNEEWTPPLRYLFSDENLKKIQAKLYTLLKCVRDDGRPIIVTLPTIANVLSQVQDNSFPELGDIYTLLQIPGEKVRDDISRMNDITTEFIYQQLKTEYEIENNNKKLTVWTTLLGDFNEHGLRQYSQLRLNNKPINKVRFNMNY
jgi:hypothetical protein